MIDIESKKLDAKVFNLKGWVEMVDAKSLVHFFQDELEKAAFNILNFVSNEFPNNGFTAIWVLAESHLALHSFAESGWTYLELTSCNRSKSEHFKANILTSTYNIKLDYTDLEDSKI